MTDSIFAGEHLAEASLASELLELQMAGVKSTEQYSGRSQYPRVKQVPVVAANRLAHIHACPHMAFRSEGRAIVFCANTCVGDKFAKASSLGLPELLDKVGEHLDGSVALSIDWPLTEVELTHFEPVALQFQHHYMEEKDKEASKVWKALLDVQFGSTNKILFKWIAKSRPKVAPRCWL